MIRRHRVGFVLAAGSVLVAGGCSSARTAGQKTTHELVKQVDETSASVEKAKAQVQTTLASYNAIISNTAGDTTKAYEQLSKEIDKCQDRAEDVRKRVEKMKKTSEGLFAQWTKAIDSLDSPELKAASQQQMEATQAKFDDIMTAVRQGKDRFDPFITELNDQVTFLGFNLTPEALANLKSRADQLNRDADAMYKAVDDMLKATETYKSSVTMPAAPPTE